MSAAVGARRCTGRGEGFVVTGGGTAGHVLPALAIARSLLARGGPGTVVRYVGSRRGMEARLLEGSGLETVLLPGRGIVRRLGLEALGAALALAAACVQALLLLARRRPAAVVTVGGYAGAPCSLAAVALGIPLVVVNLDAVPGAAVRLVARFAAASAVALPGTPLPRAVVTGAPVRDEVLALERGPAGRDRARVALGIPAGTRLVAVTGGSLGARRLNEAARDLAVRLGRRGDVLVYHVAGERDLPALEALGPLGAGSAGYRLVGFERRLPELLVAADVVVCRAGASTIAELCALGAPSVLVPLPGAPGDHQRANAAVLARRGAAVLVEDAEATGERLAGIVATLLDDPERLAAMGRAAADLGRREAAASVAGLVEAVAGGRAAPLVGSLA